MRKSILAFISVAALIVSNAEFVQGRHFGLLDRSRFPFLFSFKRFQTPSEDAREGLGRLAPNQDRDKEIGLLVKTAKSDPDPTVREQALVDLSKKICEQSKEFVSEPDEKIDAETQKQKYELLAISKQPSDEAIPRLIDIAKTHPKAVIRRHALFYLGHSGDGRALKFFEELLLKERKSRTP